MIACLVVYALLASFVAMVGTHDPLELRWVLHPRPMKPSPLKFIHLSGFRTVGIFHNLFSFKQAHPGDRCQHTVGHTPQGLATGIQPFTVQTCVFETGHSGQMLDHQTGSKTVGNPSEYVYRNLNRHESRAAVQYSVAMHFKQTK